MKVAIIGPVTTKSYFVGVATFDENLAIAFSKMGHKVVLLSSQLEVEEEETIDDVPVRKVNAFNITKYQVDLVICSLGDIKFLKRVIAKFKIAFIHGFFTAKFYGPFKAMAGIEYQKHFLKYADAVIANSEFTRFMNAESAGIKTDGSVSLGVSYDFLYELKEKEQVERESNSILFAGRLVSVKRIDRILQAVKILKDQGRDYHLYVVGEGPEQENLIRYSKDHDLGVTFTGKVNQKEIVKYYKKSEIFISLNQSEPYGITFCEALLGGCKIVCPKTGGQVEFLKDYPDTAKILQNDTPEQIADAVLSLSEVSLVDSVNTNNFTYERTAREILNIVKRKSQNG